MKSIFKLILVIITFSFIFICLRCFGYWVGYDIGTLVSDLGGLTYLYSTVGTIFAVFAAFVIISESQDWNTLTAASKNEVRELNELYLWSRRLPDVLAKEFSASIRQYLETVINKEWIALKDGIETSDTEPILSGFHDLLIHASKNNVEIGAHLFISFNELLNYRAARIEYSWQPLPVILKFTVVLVDVSVIVLSLFIGVKDPWLDYLFMVCIVTLGAVILIVVDDLDNPLRPGEWCLTNDNYRRLLQNIGNSE